MSQIINQLQKFSPKDWSGLTTKNHIGAMYGEQPIMVSELISNIYDVNLGLDFDRFMEQFETMEIERDAPFEWMLNSQSPFKNIPLLAYYTDVALTSPATSTTPGIGNSSFYLEFPDRIFEYSDVIAPASYAKETYQMPCSGLKNWLK